ncbi:MAG: hypothetical protein KJ872_07150, partial [Alphaproteobacteria bacterium]|nr:hypothetical protein [Alphaproteobacteria bacterium]
RIIAFVIQYHPHRTGTNLRRKLVRCLAHKDSIYSKVGASDNPGAVQPSGAHCLKGQSTCGYVATGFSNLKIALELRDKGWLGERDALIKEGLRSGPPMRRCKGRVHVTSQDLSAGLCGSLR